MVAWDSWQANLFSIRIPWVSQGVGGGGQDSHWHVDNFRFVMTVTYKDTVHDQYDTEWACPLGLCIILQYIGCIDTLSVRYILYHSYLLHDTSNDTILLIFRSLKFPNIYSHEICGYIKFIWSKTKQNVFLIHIEYHFMCIVICIISLKINDTEPY